MGHPLLLSIQDSNLDWLIQSQMCYHYTNGQSCVRKLSQPLESGCKSTTFFSITKKKYEKNFLLIDLQKNIFISLASNNAAKRYKMSI